MIKLFDRSIRTKKNGLIYGCFLSLVFAVVIYFRSGVSLRLLSALLFFALFYGFAWFVAYFSAVAQHQRVLAILYNDADPDRFIPEYMPLLARPELSLLTILTLKAHLANANANAGRFKEALGLLNEVDMPTGKQTPDAELLIAGNRASYYLLAEEIDHAKKACDALDSLITQYQGQKKSVNQSYLRNQLLQHVHLDMLLGKDLDESPLYQELQVSSNKLHRASVQYQLGRIYIEKGEKDTAASYLTRAAECNKVVLGQRAAELLKQIKNA